MVQTLKQLVGREWSRLRWHINRSPLKHIIKGILRRRSVDALTYRRKLVTELPENLLLDRLANDLQRDGYVILSDALDSAALQALAKAGEIKLSRAELAVQQQAMSHKKFWTRLLDEDMEDGTLSTDNPFVRFALQPAVVGVLGRVLGELPQLDYVLLTLSEDTGKELSYSQLWHRDYDDVRTIKLFVYLTDVLTQEDGPFTFLPGPVSDRFGFALRSHQDDSVILERANISEIKVMIAPKLTTFMVETSRCMHMGSRLAPGHARLLYTATFITVPRIYPEPPLRFRFSGKEDRIVRCMLLPAGQEGIH